ncbi:MAG: diphosphomevalonate decarboxylase [Candidatus Micrarchaeia archaeon]
MTTTAIAPTNIAILKYWGKNPAWEEYLIPTKSSLSFTVDGLETRTSVKAVKSAGTAPGISFSLNGREIHPEMKEYEYVAGFLEKVGRFFPFVRAYDYRIVSENNFPTSAGFASSASGFAALIKAMAGEISEFGRLSEDEAKLSALARLGSGSATRSIPSKGGIVLWERGMDFRPHRKARGGKDEIEKAMYSSIARTVYPPEHWPELSIIYAKVEAEEKKVKSRAGMKASIETNPLYDEWVGYEEGRMKREMIEAAGKKDFPALAGLIMRASNNLHQICLGTYPPIIYLNSTSIDIIDSIHQLNSGGTVKAAYTFDAGPNAVVFCLRKDEDSVAGMLEGIVGKAAVTRSRMGPGARYSKDHLF